ncbi:NADP-dependent oxidoreductase [Granulicoccus phenolivorans]|uniref:NADP-dependent oxidoreductase n=1 Tax=Granulicoccus phenolivorans TaxID=266854 RepID=UPI00047B05FA|nr:NADP-dependent oxidoreductase [Granulicoccus phenolivorans]
MRAVVIDRFGGPEELHEVTDRAVPQPRSGQLQVKVIATGLNPLDYKQRDGSSKSMAHLTAGDFPIALGRECSGTISALGPGVTGWEVGEEVMAFCNDVTDGSYAEYVCTPADMTTRIPAGGDPVKLAGLPIAGFTAWTSVHERARVQAGEKVLIHGGSGGVGQFLVQLCVRAGAEVWATASTRNQDRLRELGVHHPIDYRTQDWQTLVPQVDVVLDTVYFGTFEPSLDHLRPGGRIVVLPSLADLTPATKRGIEASIPGLHPMPAVMDELARDVTSGALDLEIAEVLPLSEVARAHRMLEEGHTRGKLIATL